MTKYYVKKEFEGDKNFEENTFGFALGVGFVVFFFSIMITNDFFKTMGIVFSSSIVVYILGCIIMYIRWLASPSYIEISDKRQK